MDLEIQMTLRLDRTYPSDDRIRYDINMTGRIEAARITIRYTVSNAKRCIIVLSKAVYSKSNRTAGASTVHAGGYVGCIFANTRSVGYISV